MVTKTQTSHVAKQLAVQAKKSIDAIWAAEQARDESESNRLQERLESLVDEVQWHPAGSKEGALFQAAIIVSELTSFYGVWIEESQETPAGRALNRMTRLAKNVLEFLEQTTGMDREALNLQYFAGHRPDFQPPAPAAPEGPSPRVLDAIDRHRKVIAEMRCAPDNDISDDIGDRLHDAERECMADLIDCRTASLADIRAKAAYIRSLDDEGALSAEDAREFATGIA